MRGHQLWGFGIAALGFIGLLVWIDAFFVSHWPGELFRGIGVEVIGALITALGVIGLDRLYAEPNREIAELSEQVKQLHATLETLIKHLDTNDGSAHEPNSPTLP
jgi:hypothetical protein